VKPKMQTVPAPRSSADTRHRSGCPINLALEVFGDRWTLLIVRDLMFAGKRQVLAQIGIWSRSYMPVSNQLGATAEALERGGPDLWEQCMAALRASHMQVT
jgi:hypothetical protein